MSQILKAIRYRNLDEARKALQDAGVQLSDDPFTDGNKEPDGLLSVVPEDLIPEEAFYQLFSLKKGVLVRVEKIDYSGFGPPAEEDEYMGFSSRGFVYVLEGCRLAIEIEDCPHGARDIHQLEAQVMDHEHPLNRTYVAEKLGLPLSWSFEDLFALIGEGSRTATEIDQIIHRGNQ
jgi:hypothetical protein